MLLDRLLFRLPILAAKHPANPAFCAQHWRYSEQPSSAGTSSQRCARMADCRLMLFSGRFPLLRWKLKYLLILMCHSKAAFQNIIVA